MLRILEKQFGGTRKILSRDTPSSRGVELMCEIAGQRFALEHTLIEPFPDNQRDNIEFERIFDDGFEAAVRDVLKPDLAYSIWVDVYAFNGMSSKRRAAARQTLIDWVRSAAPRLPLPSKSRTTSIRAVPPNVSVEIRLSCHFSEALGGSLSAGRLAPSALEDLRRARLLKALQDKSPKLFIAKTPARQTRTVLVLENQDIALTDEGTLQTLLEELNREITQMPDDVFVVGTYTRNRFYVVQLRSNGQSSFLLGEKHGDWEFDASSLEDI